MSAPKGRQVNTPTGGKEQPSHTAPRAQERPESKVSALEDRTLVCNLSSHRDSRATSPFVSEGQLVPSCEDPEDPRSGMCPQTTRRSCQGSLHCPPLPPQKGDPCTRRAGQTLAGRPMGVMWPARRGAGQRTVGDGRWGLSPHTQLFPAALRLEEETWSPG